jgi:sialate O-acetylesterase
MATTIDVGMAKDIHPKNKQAVGSRLAQWALSTVYEQPIPASGPLFANAVFDSGSAMVSFGSSSAKLQALHGDALKGFAIAGKDRVFKFAKAEIHGEQVRVWHPEISAPVAVRYAFGDNPDCNLGNTAMLPASPFRSDSWKLQ